uniref:Titin n=1 Tax=Hippocampus comes TaxID=109280 RepID=A0A3Q3E2Y6_HIPCM
MLRIDLQCDTCAQSRLLGVLADVPGPPVNPRVTDTTKTTATLNWGKPLDNGGLDVTGYVIEHRKEGTEDWVKDTPSSALRITEFVVPGLENASKYHFRISAVNAKGTGDPAETADLVEVAERAAEPDLELDMELRRTLVVRAGCSIRLFVPIKGRPTPTVTWTKENGPVPRAVIDSTESFTMLIVPESARIDGGKYELTLENAAGKKTANIHVRVLDSPGPPLNLKAVHIDQESIALQWETPLIDEVENTLKLDVKFNEMATTLSNKDSVRSDGGEFVLTAANVGGISKHIFRVKVLDRPGPPFGPLRVSNVTADNCLLTWAPPLDDGGGKIEGYVVEKRESSRLVWTHVASDLQATEYKVTKLLQGNEYIFRVMAVNRFGSGEPLESEPILAENPYKVPDAPENPQVTAVTKDSMVVVWQAPKSDGGTPITNYNIERKDRAGHRWVKCNKRKVQDLQFKATSLIVGHEYEFRIIAENAAGLSAPSLSSPFYKATDTLYKPGPPCNPRILDTTKSSITVAWNKPAYDGGSDITGYLVEKCIPSDKEEEEEWTIVTPKEGLLATSFTIVNLTEGQEYKINISAVNGEGIGEPAVQVNVVVLDKPGEPQGPLTVTDITKDQCCLSWKAPIQDGGSKISHYSVERRETSRLIWTIVDPKVLNTCHKVTKLLEGNEYIFRVHAINEFGSSAPLVSEPVIIKDPYTAPGSPKGLEIADVKKDSMVLTWEAPNEDGGSPITTYVIEKHDKEGVRWIRCNRQAVLDLTFKVTGLLESHSYEFRVAAENSVGVGEPTSPTVYYKALDPVFRPGPPQNPRVIDTTKSSVFLSWSKPLFDGGSEIQGYIVEYAPAEDWLTCTPPTGVRKTKFEVLNLKENQAYKFRVCASNKVGIGEHADVAGAVVTQDRADEPDLDIDPELRKIVTIKAGLSLRLFIPIKGRPTPSIKWDKDDAPLQEKAQVEVTSSYTALVIDQMNRADSGKYTITAENSSGTKSAFVVVRVLDTPSAPGKLTVKEITSQSVTLAWEVPLLDGGSKIKNYIVEKRESTRKTYAAVVTNCHALSWKIEPLQEGCSYYFRVLAENAYGIGLPAVTVDPLKVSEVPQAPRSLTVTDQTNTSISLAWESPEYDGGSRVIQYLLEVQLKGQEKCQVTFHFTMRANSLFNGPLLCHRGAKRPRETRSRKRHKRQRDNCLDTSRV